MISVLHADDCIATSRIISTDSPDYVTNAWTGLELFGGALLVVGVWARAEKDTLANLSQLTNMALDPALLLILIGLTIFLIGFAGCVGSLRENTWLLLFFMITLSIIFVLELLLGILGFVYKDWVRDQIESQVRNMIINYRDDADLQNLVDWVQQDWLGCCDRHGSVKCDRRGSVKCDRRGHGSVKCDRRGSVKCAVKLDLFQLGCCGRHGSVKRDRRGRGSVKCEWCSEACLFQLGCCGVHRYEDWEANVYFNCTSPGVEACGVPFSCCKHTDEIMVNRHCGYDMMKLTHDYDRNIQIYTSGCIPAGEKWLESNLIPVAGVAVGIALLQVMHWALFTFYKQAAMLSTEEIATGIVHVGISVTEAVFATSQQPVVTKAVFATSQQPVVTKAVFATSQQPVVTKAVFATSQQPVVTKAVFATSQQPVVTKAVFATSQQPVVTKAVFATSQQPVVTKVVFATSQQPVVTKAVFATSQQPVVTEAVFATSQQTVVTKAVFTTSQQPVVTEAV
ncbi:hypothetical protein ACOMHN_058385 [Nucella lapillus]